MIQQLFKQWLKNPRKQKYNKGTFVQVGKDLGHSMRHFENDCPAMVEYTYAEKYGGNDIKSYSLLLKCENGTWESVSWYEEEQLKRITNSKLLLKYKKEILKQRSIIK